MMKKIKKIFRSSYKHFSKSNASLHGAALSYYAILSIAPLLVILISLASFFIKSSDIQGLILSELQNVLGQNGASFIKAMIEGQAVRNSGIIALIIGAVTLFFGAMYAFSELQASLDAIFSASKKPSSGVMAFIADKTASFTIVIALGLLLVVFVSLNSIILYVGNRLQEFIPFSNILLQVMNYLLTFVFLTFIFALFYKYLPHTNITFRHSLIGGLVTSILFVIGQFLLVMYLALSHQGNGFGPASSFIIIMIWIYYSAQIFFFGASFTATFREE